MCKSKGLVETWRRSESKWLRRGSPMLIIGGSFGSGLTLSTELPKARHSLLGAPSVGLKGTRTESVRDKVVCGHSLFPREHSLSQGSIEKTSLSPCR